MLMSRWGVVVVIAASCSLMGVAQAQTVADVLDPQESYQESARASQQRVDALDDETISLLSAYHAELERHEDLLTYNENMRSLLASQQSEKARLQAELEEIEVVRRAIVPLMVEMVDVLEQFVGIDLPLLVDERNARVEALRANLTRSDVDIAEKYRRVIEAYQIEAEYGQSIEAYESPITLAGRELTVDLLRVGRVGLYYLSLDREEGGIWDPAANSWKPVESGYLGELDYALRVARKQAPPNLVRLPVWTESAP